MDAAEVAVLKERLETILREVRAIQYTLNGNGKEGLVIRLDRIEQVHKRLGKWVAAAVAAATTAATSQILRWFLT